MAGHHLSPREMAATGRCVVPERRTTWSPNWRNAGCGQQDGYLAAFFGAFDRLEGKPGNSGGVVVPYYTIHKIMAGLLDAHRYLGNTLALQVAVKMADYCEKRLARSSRKIEKIFRTDGSRNPQNEFGAMSDVLAELYAVTGDRSTGAAQRSTAWFAGPLAKAGSAGRMPARILRRSAGALPIIRRRRRGEGVGKS
jgi:hypothetical protein